MSLLFSGYEKTGGKRERVRKRERGRGKKKR